MFTGIVEETGKVKSFDGVNLEIEADVVLANTKIGDSISVNGCCQTVVKISGKIFTVNVSSETLRVTNFNKIKSGDIVNLERALALGERLGGHIVQGHIETVVTLSKIEKLEEFYNMTFSGLNEFDKYIINKGSVTLNGISLTVAKMSNNALTVAVIPHTFNNTNLKTLNIGDKVNLETDVLAKYVEKIISSNKSKTPIDENFLVENGFM